MSKEEVHRAIPLLEDLARVFKRIDGVFQMENEGKSPNATDYRAPIPQNGALSERGKCHV